MSYQVEFFWIIGAYILWNQRIGETGGVIIILQSIEVSEKFDILNKLVSLISMGKSIESQRKRDKEEVASQEESELYEKTILPVAVSPLTGRQ